MLHRGGSDPPPRDRRLLHADGGGATKVLLAVAPPPRPGNPTRWGWPHWLAPAYPAGEPPAGARRTLEDFA